jgi:tetratricopeptide (TPR) repeat protein
MATDDFRVFISAATSEFGAARNALAADLRARGLIVKVQSDFRQEELSDTTLKKLHDYIRDCSAVICVIGKRSGACPPPAAAAPFAHMLPNGIGEGSYTQWEFFFARQYRRRLSIYIANEDYVPDESAPTSKDFPDLQRALIKHIVDEQGLDRSYFSNIDQLSRAVLKEHWPNKRAGKPIVLPYTSLGHLFKGRDEFMRRLHASLLRGGHGQAATIITAIYGLGGIGKTRAAVEYAWAHQDEYDALLSATADTPEALRRNLAALVGPLVLPERNTTDDEVRLAAVLDWLRSNPHWFLVLDNLDTPEAVEEAERLMGRLTGGHVVMTSRLSNFAAHIDPIELDVLGVDDAADFLLERTKGRRRESADDVTKARELAVELGGLALMLEQAGAYIARDRLTFGRYQDQWRSNRAKVMTWWDPTVTHYPRAVAITWQTSIERLSESARRLLRRLAWLAPEPIPESLLDFPIPDLHTEDLRGALADLAAYSLVTRQAARPTFAIHRLVQDVTRRSVAADASPQSLIETLDWINAAFTGDPTDVRDWPQLDPLAPHARAVAAHGDEAEIAAPTSRLMNQLGVLLQAKALNGEAEPLLRRTLVIDELRFGPDHPEVAIQLNNLAHVLRDTNRWAEAEPLMRRALAIDEKNLGSDHANVAIRLSNLASLLKDTNRLAEAEPLMRRALASDEKNLGPDHPNVGIRLNNLAGLLKDTNRLAEAEPLMRRALSIDEKNFGSGHPKVAIRLNNLANLLQDTDRLVEAEALMRRALAINETSLGLDHPNVAISLNNLALLMKITNRLPEAEPLMRRALAIDERSFGPDHPAVAIDLSNLANLLQYTNRLAEAEPLMRRALAIDEKSFGPKHPNVAIRLNNLAMLLHDTNRSLEAEPLMRRALAIVIEFELKSGHRHPGLVLFSENYANLLKAAGKTPTEISAAIDGLKNLMS